MDKERLNISISTSSVVRVLLILVLFGVIFILKDLILVLLTAIIIASAVEPAAAWFEKRKIPRLLAVLFVYVAAAIVIIAVFYFILPKLSQEILIALDSLQKYTQTSDTSSTSFSLLSWKPIVEALTGALPLKDALATFGSSFSTVSGGVFNAVSNIFGGVISFIVLFVLSFYLAVQRDGVSNFLKIITPVRHEVYVLDLWKRSQRKIGQWMQGQLLLSLIIGLLAYLGLTLLGVRDALILAFFAGLCEFIPLFGPIIGAVPAVLFAYVDSSFTIALLVTGMYLLIHQLENQIIYPLVVRKIVGINPIIVIISLIAGYELAGFLGMVISVPLATIGMEYLRDVERGKNPAPKLF